MKIDRLLRTSDGLGPFLQLTADSVVELHGYVYCAIKLSVGDRTAIVAASGILPPAGAPGFTAIYEKLLGDAGQVLGTLEAFYPGTISEPKLAIVQEHREQAATAVRVTLAAQEDLARVRIADSSRSAVRSLAANPDVTAVWPEILQQIAQAYEADSVLVHMVNLDTTTGVIGNEHADQPPAAVLDFLTGSARSAWREHRAEVYPSIDHRLETVRPQMRRDIREWLTNREVTNTLLVPIGAADECLGSLVLSRRNNAAWSTTDIEGATAMGADLGLVLFSKRSLEAQVRYVAELQAIDQYQDDLLDTVTDLLQAPLERIQVELDQLDGRPTVGAIDQIESDVAAMTCLVDDLLFFSRVTDPRRAREATPVNIATLARTSADQLYPMADDVDVRVRTSGNFPMVRGDAAELSQMLTNVIRNALQFTDRGSVVVCVSSGATEAEISVRDTGVGLSPAESERVFDEFFRGANSRGIPGSGLGLSIASRVTERHGGRIAFDSTLGEGSTVLITLPLAPTDQ